MRDKMLFIIFIIILLLSGYWLISNKHTSTGEKKMFIGYIISIRSKENISYQFILPIPIYKNGNPVFNLTDFNQDFDDYWDGYITNLSYTNTEYGLGIKVEGKGMVCLYTPSIRLNENDLTAYEGVKYSMYNITNNSLRIWIYYGPSQKNNKISIQLQLYYFDSNSSRMMLAEVFSEVSEGWNEYSVKIHSPPQKC